MNDDLSLAFLVWALRNRGKLSRPQPYWNVRKKSFSGRKLVNIAIGFE